MDLLLFNRSRKYIFQVVIPNKLYIDSLAIEEHLEIQYIFHEAK